MALLTLQDIGKIYVSEGNVAVGIRGVNLSFDRGEFVAITGKSGSGKSTLLNVISGMDSYEEGELTIEGQTTSHYLQPEWEEYRKKYISFIFQDYNIIESFTVLQNVELALMHIQDKKERRKRALELLDRVGLTSHIRQKGSKLSGGQKQRTVIARALAKDSPIILADEPTGNLDAATSKEIIALLREVSKDKLVIVVTHNFEQVEEYATRHIRVYDGAIESDHVLRQSQVICTSDTAKPEGQTAVPKSQRKKEIKDGITLGRTIFAAKPKLSVFLCLLMIIGTMGIFMDTALSGNASHLFDKHYMFEPINGRLVITKQTGEPITDEELRHLQEEYGAKESLHYDILLDKSVSSFMKFYNPNKDRYEYDNFQCTYGKNYGTDVIGRYPEADNEVFLHIPISYQPIFGKNSIKTHTISYNDTVLQVTGVKYFYDNNQKGECLFTQNGFRMATAIHYLMNSDGSVSLSLVNEKGTMVHELDCSEFLPSYEVEEGKMYVADTRYQHYIHNGTEENWRTIVNFRFRYWNYNFNNQNNSAEILFSKQFGDDFITSNDPHINGEDKKLLISPALLCELAEEVLEKSYRQASLFFENNEQAYAAAEKLSGIGYMAVPSDTTYSPDAGETILIIVSGLMTAASWLLTIMFLAFFINLCSSRALGAFKSDMAIMRSMGIQANVIRIGMYVRMIISLIPAFILVVVTGILIFTTPKFNGMFTYLYPWQYGVIFLGMLLLTVRITYKQIKKLFGESVKKSLRGDAAE